jgi:hypothetical protein
MVFTDDANRHRGGVILGDNCCRWAAGKSVMRQGLPEANRLR